ncbi:MAG: hypothetical protein M0Z64_10055 [Nitrospiraceae bacterium]|nr:hypothetical protein [Nitrospiraceae bacterium]
MFQGFKDVSLKKKVYIIFGVLIASAVIGILMGQIFFQRVQVGGKFYAQIERNMVIADDIAKLRVNLTLVRAHLLTMMLEDPWSELYSRRRYLYWFSRGDCKVPVFIHNLANSNGLAEIKGNG